MTENIFAKPKITKIIINMGLKEALTDKKVLESVAFQLAQITGQKPITTFARKAIAAFKLRKGDPIGAKVTLRGKRMNDFFQKLVGIVLPRVRDFRGVSPAGFDGRGNYTLGIKELLVFPEVDFAKIDKQSFSSNKARGLEMTMVTTAKNDEEGRKLLEELGMPFKK
ncbi:MAG: large subunit ribosomal protein L5 [Microgenomates group bacterium LiPW_16]|nr:MAG: large subunit ribosomal protein L5 [Microgenomates group bacterium LiPW_16]